MNDLFGKTAIITGGARGIGRASARILAEHGALVWIADIARDCAEETCEEFRREGLSAFACRLDIRDQQSVRDMTHAALSKTGSIDILVNNAGIIDTTSMLELTQEGWDKMIDINLRGAHFCTQACVKHMIEQKGGRIVFMSSRGGQMGSSKVAPSYNAAKGGLLALCKSYALFCAPHNINCNAIAPGWIVTNMTLGRDDPAQVPLQRLGKPEDVAGSVYFLCSYLSEYITGATIDVNGGLYIRA
jgi:3-oxoacyl-[acyl-carrier protein] reductase